MPCWSLFEAETAEYRAAVLGTAPRVGVEAAVRLGWDRWIGPEGAFIGMRGFGASGLTVLEALGGPSERLREARAESFDLADVAQRCRANQGIANGVQQYVSIRMSGQSAFIRDGDAADDEFAPLSERVYVKALAYAHSDFRS